MHTYREAARRASQPARQKDIFTYIDTQVHRYVNRYIRPSIHPSIHPCILANAWYTNLRTLSVLSLLCQQLNLDVGSWANGTLQDGWRSGWTQPLVRCEFLMSGMPNPPPSKEKTLKPRRPETLNTILPKPPKTQAAGAPPSSSGLP